MCVSSRCAMAWARSNACIFHADLVDNRYGDCGLLAGFILVLRLLNILTRGRTHRSPTCRRTRRCDVCDAFDPLDAHEHRIANSVSDEYIHIDFVDSVVLCLLSYHSPRSPGTGLIQIVRIIRIIREIKILRILGILSILRMTRMIRMMRIIGMIRIPCTSDSRGTGWACNLRQLRGVGVASKLVCMASGARAAPRARESPGKQSPQRLRAVVPVEGPISESGRGSAPGLAQVLAQLEERERPSMVVILYEQRGSAGTLFCTGRRFTREALLADVRSARRRTPPTHSTPHPLHRHTHHHSPNTKHAHRTRYAKHARQATPTPTTHCHTSPFSTLRYHSPPCLAIAHHDAQSTSMPYHTPVYTTAHRRPSAQPRPTLYPCCSRYFSRTCFFLWKAEMRAA